MTKVVPGQHIRILLLWSQAPVMEGRVAPLSSFERGAGVCPHQEDAASSFTRAQLSILSPPGKRSDGPPCCFIITQQVVRAMEKCPLSYQVWVDVCWNLHLPLPHPGSKHLREQGGGENEGHRREGQGQQDPLSSFGTGLA